MLGVLKEKTAEGVTAFAYMGKEKYRKLSNNKINNNNNNSN